MPSPSEPGLYGLGCATHRERPLAVAINDYLRPFVIGKNPEEIENIWQSAYVSSYFRSGVTLNNALSGIDGALWDICGKRAGMPLYKLLGGKVRAAAPLYAHASARELPALEDQVRKFMAQGYRHVHVQLAVPGFSGYGAANPTSESSLFASSSWKTPSLPKTSIGLRPCASRPPRRSPWENSSSIAMSGSRWWPTAGSISSAFTYPPSEASAWPAK